MRRLWDELRRRGVVKIAAAYALLALGILEASGILTDAFSLPAGTVQFTFWGLIVGFPIACAVAWRYDLTAEGVLRAESHRAVVASLKERESPSVAILPLVDLSRKGDQAYFADGVAAEITTAVASVPGLGVASLTSAFAMRGVPDTRVVARELGVDTVLQGTVRKDAKGVQIRMELVDGETGIVAWNERYDRSLDDIIDVQEDIAREVANHLRQTLGEGRAAPKMRPHSPDPAAYELYLQARYFWTRRHEVGLEKSIECYEQAIAIDPRYALAYAGLADVHMFKGFYLIADPGVAFSAARRAIDAALRHAPEQAEVHRAQGMMRTWYEWDFDGAESSFRRALELDSTDPMAPLMFGQLLAALGRRDEARGMAERGRRLDPTSTGAVGLTAVAFAINRDGERAVELTDSVLTRDTVSFLNRYIAGTANLGLGRYDAAIQHLELAAELSRRNPLIVTFLAQCYARAGQEAPARELLKSIGSVPAGNYPYGGQAAVLAALGETDSVTQDMDEAIQRREPYLFISGSAPVFDPLRAHPDYPSWMRRIGLPLLDIQP